MNYTHDYTDYIYEVSRKTCDQDNTLFELNVELYGEQSELDPSAHESLESIPLFSGIELFNKVTDKYSVKIIESESRLSFLRSCITDYLRLLELNGENAPIMIVLAFEVYDSKEKHVGFMVQGLSHTKFYYIEGGKELQEELYLMRGLTSSEMEDVWVVNFYQKLSRNSAEKITNDRISGNDVEITK